MLFIINPISGKGKKRKIADKLSAKGYKVVFTEYAGHAEQLAREAAERIVVAVGGDGTVNEVARGLIGTDKALGIIPCGSGDGLALHLGLSRNPDKALKVIERGKWAEMDAAQVNGRLFLSVSGVGFDAQVSERFAKSGKRGLANYIRQGIRTWMDYVSQKYTVEIDGSVIETEALFITVGNSDQWGNGAKITPLADCCDGILDVTIVKPFGWLAMPAMAYRLMTGTLDRSPYVRCCKCRNVRIVRDADGPAHADGDWFIASDVLDIGILPSALRILV